MDYTPVGKHRANFIGQDGIESEKTDWSIKDKTGVGWVPGCRWKHETMTKGAAYKDVY
jgi:hypothetical protein